MAAELKRAKLEEQRLILEEQLQYAEDELQSAEAALQNFRIETITLPSDQATPNFANYFQRKITLEQLESDRRRLQDVLDSIPASGVRVRRWRGSPRWPDPPQLRQVLGEPVEARAQLRALRDSYRDDYPPVQGLLERMERLETGTRPSLVRGLDAELAAQVASLNALVESASGELTNIPARTIEEARLRRQVVIQETLYNTLRTRVESARLAAASSIPDVRVLDEARVPEYPMRNERLKLCLPGPSPASWGRVSRPPLLLDHTDPLLRDPLQVESEMNLVRAGGQSRRWTRGRRRTPTA